MLYSVELANQPFYYRFCDCKVTTVFGICKILSQLFSVLFSFGMFFFVETEENGLNTSVKPVLKPVLYDKGRVNSDADAAFVFIP